MTETVIFIAKRTNKPNWLQYYMEIAEKDPLFWTKISNGIDPSGPYTYLETKDGFVNIYEYSNYDFYFELLEEQKGKNFTNIIKIKFPDPFLSHFEFRNSMVINKIIMSVDSRLDIYVDNDNGIVAPINDIRRLIKSDYDWLCAKY